MVRFLGALGLALLAHSVLLAQDSARVETTVDILTRAYAEIHEDPAAATRLFEQAVQEDSTNVLIRRQLGMLYTNSKDYDKALASLQAANTLSYSDTIALQMAYILNILERNKEAYAMFATVQSSTDPEISRIAVKSMEVLEQILCARSYPWWGRVYASPFYDSRFENSIIFGSIHAGYFPTDGRVVSVYSTLSLTRDTRSRGGTAPQIFSDNYILAAIGGRVEPLPNVITDIQLGVAFDLLARPGKAGTSGDFRIVSSYGGGLYPHPPTEVGFHSPFKLFADWYSSVGYYSRYSNVIGYADIRGGVRVATLDFASFDLYVRGNLSFDTDAEFYNNVVEESIGARVIPNDRWGLSILLELHRGTYWRSSTTTNPYEDPYTSFRVFIILDRPLCW